MQNKFLKCSSPCKDCPYRKDAPLKLWQKFEFVKLMKDDKEQFARIYYCHKNNGNVCVGYLMNQDKRRLPNLNLRMILSKYNITTKQLDALKCKVPMYDTIEEMCEKNYQELRP